MKKVLLPLSLGVLVAATASAQSITLNQSSFASANMSGTDTLLTTAANPTYPTLTADAGANLDFTSATADTNRRIQYRVAPTSGSQWADSTTLSFVAFNYKANLESSLSATGYVQNGEHINRSAFSISAVIPADPITTDSLVINAQDIAFSAPRTRIAFPATNQSNWSSTYKYDLSFNLTLTPAALNNVPGIVRAFVTEKDTVIGYGKVKVNGDTAYTDVLQIEAITTTTDSFFLNNVPAPVQIIGAFGLSQGETIASKDQYYFRAGDLTPMVHITFDSTSNTPATTETEFSKALPNFIPETQYTRTLNVYPNPVTGHTILVSGAPANYGNWNYELENVTGQVVTKGALQLSNNQSKTSIALSNSITPGTYFLHMYNNAAQETVRTLTIK